jgi:hypothetical protein
MLTIETDSPSAVSTVATLREEAADRFITFLDSGPHVDDIADFAAVIAAAIDMHGIQADRMALYFGVSRSTIGRWRAGANAPQPFARRLVLDWIRSELVAQR